MATLRANPGVQDAWNRGAQAPRLIRCALAGSIALACLAPQDARAQQAVADGSTILLPSGGEYFTTSPVGGGDTTGYALFALNAGYINAEGPVTAATSGNGAAAARAQGDGSMITLRGGFLLTSGSDASGLFATEGGFIRAGFALGGPGVIIQTTGSESHGLTAEQGAVIELSDARMTTFGARSHGLNVATGAHVAMNGGFIGVTSGNAVSVSGATAALYDVEVVVVDGHGVVADHGAAARIELGTVRTLGDNAHAVVLTSSGASFRGGQVRTEGAGAWAAVLGDSSVLAMDGGSLVSNRHGAIRVRGGAEIAFTNTARVAGGDGVLMAVDAAIADPVRLRMDTGAQAHGDIVIGTEDIDNGVPFTTDVGMDLEEGARWEGATEVVNMLDIRGGAFWQMTGDSTVQALRLDNAAVALSRPGTAGFHTLTVAGDYSGNNGTFLFNTVLADDASPSDRLVIKGSTSGQTNVAVNNIGGSGAQTINGIPLIEVGGASNGQFDLAGRAVGGQYEYFLFKGGKADPNDGDWYLRSELPAVPDPCDADPTLPGCTPVVPPDPDPCLADPNAPGCVITLPEQCLIDPSLPQCLPPVPVLRPEPGAYLANQSAATKMFGMRMHDRNGGTARGLAERGAWARVSRNQADYGVIGDQLTVNGDTDVLQVGTDVFTWGEGSRGQLGVTLGGGRANNTVTSRLTGYSARGRVEGQAIGVYGSWLQDAAQTTGLYVDAWANHTQFKNSVRGEALNKERYDSKADSASVEAGYGFQVVNGERIAMFVEPQLQLSYTRFSADSHIESNGTVINGSDADGPTSRAGVRFFGHANTVVGNRVQPFVSINWIHASSDNSLRFDGERVAGGLPQNSYEAKAGASLQLGGRWSAWGDLALQRGDGGYKDVSCQIGLRSSW
jgi:autotransporter family porin